MFKNPEERDEISCMGDIRQICLIGTESTWVGVKTRREGKKYEIRLERQIGAML